MRHNARAGHHPPHQSHLLSTHAVGQEGDDSWRFYINYRTLNKQMSKDKFLIPMVDELHGANYFTRLNLCSSYYH